MAEMPLFVEIEATRKLCNGPSGFSWANDDLVALCSQLDEQNTSNAFREAWAQIETTFTPSQPLRGLAVPVRIIIGKLEYVNESGIASQHVWDVINNALCPDQVRWGWFSSRLGRHTTLTRRHRSSFYSTSVVNSVNAKSALTFNRTSGAFTKLLTEMGGRTYFSALDFHLVYHRNSQHVCRMISKLFCEETCTSDVAVGPRTVGHASVSLRERSGVEMNALCSALAVTRSCRSVMFNLSSHDSLSTVKAWQWMAYALFSNRARSHSSVKQVSIYNAHLNPTILDTLSRILTAANTEQELFAFAKGLETTSRTAWDTREYHLRKNAIVQVIDDVTGRVASWDSANIFQQDEVSGAVLVNLDDDKSTEWMDALVPGIGLCQVQRNDLVVCDHVSGSNVQPDLELELQFCDDLPWLGRHLYSLWLEIPSTTGVDVFRLLESCPHLQELTLREDIVVHAQNVVRACEQCNTQLCRLDCRFDDIDPLLVALRDKSHVLAGALRWWVCHLELQYHYVTHAEPILGELTRTLTANKALRYLTVMVNKLVLGRFYDGLRQFNLQEVEGVGEVPVACNTLLSVFHAAEVQSPLKKQAKDKPDRLRLQAPDVHVTTNIFEFAKHAVRKVNVVAPISDWKKYIGVYAG